MRKMRKAAVLLMAMVMALAMTGASVFADSTKIEGEATFNGNDIVSTLDEGTVVKAFNDLQPGDDITVSIAYRNDYGKSTDWYMANEVVKTLEKTDQARKIAGTEKAENGGYTYSLVHTDKSGAETVLFSNDKVGGDAKPANMEGLEQATNALDDWFFLQTLGKGESGKVTLSVKFDGETEVNDYMDTEGEVLVRFAVELTKVGKPGKDGPSHQQTATGDSFPIWPFLLMMLAGIALLVLLLVRRRRNEEGGEA